MPVTGDITGLSPVLMARLEALSTQLGEDIVVTSGRRAGAVEASAHHSGIAADVRVASKNTIGMADALVAAGFTGVGEYYEADRVTPRAFAHGDIRGLPGSENAGPYAADGLKSRPLCWTGYGNPPVYEYGSRKSGGICP